MIGRIMLHKKRFFSQHYPPLSGEVQHRPQMPPLSLRLNPLGSSLLPLLMG
ncbi:high-affinity zinc uptake system protein ZnuA [Escherichia coli M718]|nr:high-affinity zinc uptake system protein ZnuA [Escherichia coli M718]